MAKITCAISGIRFECTHFAKLSISHNEGYFHPIFAASYDDLYKLYSAHCKGRITHADSYLLFLAFLHSSDQIIWEHPATLDPWERQTQQLVENNFAQLVAILEKTNVIRYSSFAQPSFRVTFENSNLAQIANWIKAWEDNLVDFRFNVADEKTKRTLLKITGELSYLILSGSKPEEFSDVIAEWADKAACFPPNLASLYKKTITGCFHMDKMFKTPLELLKEIKDFCLCNIEAGSIHFHTLIKVLDEGISMNINYLGGSTLSPSYTLLPKLGNKGEEYTKADERLLKIAASAPEKEPVKEDYETPILFLKARLAYKVANTTFATTTTPVINTKEGDL